MVHEYPLVSLEAGETKASLLDAELSPKEAIELVHELGEPNALASPSPGDTVTKLLTGKRVLGIRVTSLLEVNLVAETLPLSTLLKLECLHPTKALGK